MPRAIVDVTSTDPLVHLIRAHAALTSAFSNLAGETPKEESDELGDQFEALDEALMNTRAMTPAGRAARLRLLVGYLEDAGVCDWIMDTARACLADVEALAGGTH